MELPASWIGMTAMMSNTSLVTSDQIQAFTAELGQ
jgi:hypothetical protein